MSFREVQSAVIARAEAGWSLDRIDAVVIEPSSLSAEEKAAAWIVARAEVAHHSLGARRYFQRQAEAYRRARTLTPVGTD